MLGDFRDENVEKPAVSNLPVGKLCHFIYNVE